MYGAVVLGAILWLLFELNKARTKEGYSFKTFIKLNWIPMSLNVVSGIVLVYSKDSFEDFLKVTTLVAVYFGFSGQALFKKISGVFDKRIATNIGINK